MKKNQCQHMSCKKINFCGTMVLGHQYMLKKMLSVIITLKKGFTNTKMCKNFSIHKKKNCFALLTHKLQKNYNNK